MPVVGGTRYGVSVRRDGPDFDRAVETAIAALRARAGGAADDNAALMTYSELSHVLAGDGLHVPAHGEPMSSILEAASARENASGRGLISALVVLADTRQPASGFDNLARRYGRNGDATEIWLREVRRIRAEATSIPQADGGNRRVTAAGLGAWMLKCNPEIWDLGRFRQTGDTIEAWSVVKSYRTDLMAAGQQVVFWATGKDDADITPGLWGVGEVTGPAFEADVDEDDDGLWLDEGQRTRSRLFVPVDIRLYDHAVPRRLLKADPRLAGMEIFRQPQMSNPLVVTQEEMAALGDHLPVETPQVITVNASGAGFGSYESRAVVEVAAMDAVTDYYRDLGWSVEDVSAQCLGWDITASSPGGEIHKVEVKGVSGLKPIILLTRNEARAAGTELGWLLAIVTQALTEPKMMFKDGAATLAAAAPFMFQADFTRPVSKACLAVSESSRQREVGPVRPCANGRERSRDRADQRSLRVSGSAVGGPTKSG